MPPLRDFPLAVFASLGMTNPIRKLLSIVSDTVIDHSFMSAIGNWFPGQTLSDSEIVGGINMANESFAYCISHSPLISSSTYS
jgi:hypothetical protein